MFYFLIDLFFEKLNRKKFTLSAHHIFLIIKLKKKLDKPSKYFHSIIVLKLIYLINFFILKKILFTFFTKIYLYFCEIKKKFKNI